MKTATVAPVATRRGNLPFTIVQQTDAPWATLWANANGLKNAGIIIRPNSILKITTFHLTNRLTARLQQG